MTGNIDERKTTPMRGSASCYGKGAEAGEPRSCEPRDLCGLSARAPNPAAIPVALFGYGEWCRSKWFPVLAQLARWGVIELTVVERWTRAEVPTELALPVEEGVLRYLSWDDYVRAGEVARWRVVYVVTSASAHHRVIHSLLESASDLKVIVCEKPCGKSIEQALEIFVSCQRRAVALLVADHYLLRPCVQYLLAHPELLCAIGTPSRIIASINESKETRLLQGVIADLLIHLLDLLMTLFPGATFMPDVSYTAQAIGSTATEHETYTLAAGSLNLADGSAVYCALEGGKQLDKDDKSITMYGETGSLHLDLINNTLRLVPTGEEARETRLTWEAQWSYARLILKSLSMS